MKIDTQGMSYGTGKGDGTSIEEQRAKIPDVKPKEINIISDALKKELKDIIGGTQAAKNAAAGKGKYTPGKGVTKDFKLDPAFKLPKA